MLTKSPSNVRILVTRSVTSSTRPSTQPTTPSGPRRTMSPTPNWRSAMMYKPAMTSPTICCAPKPKPAPAIEPRNTKAEAGKLSLSRTVVIATAIMQKLMPHRNAPSTAARCAPVVSTERSSRSLACDFTCRICCSAMNAVRRMSTWAPEMVMMIATKSVRSHDSMVSLPVVAASMAIENIVIRLRETVGSTVSLQGCWHSHPPNLYDA